MAITTADGFFGAARQKVLIRKTASATAVAAQLHTLWDRAGNPGAGSLSIGNTTSGVIPTATTAGAPAIAAFGGGALGYIAGGQFRNSVAGGAILYDRIWHAGSVSMTSLATTTFSSQPDISGRLPAGLAYGGLEILLEINTAVSATATTIAVTYTNESGTTGRATGATASLSGYITGRVIAMPLQAGDKGVQKIESVIVGGTVASAGTFNVIIGRKLAEFDVRLANGADLQPWDAIGSPQIFADSCLWLVGLPDSTATGLPTLSLDIING